MQHALNSTRKSALIFVKSKYQWIILSSCAHGLVQWTINMVKLMYYGKQKCEVSGTTSLTRPTQNKWPPFSLTTTYNVSALPSFTVLRIISKACHLCSLILLIVPMQHCETTCSQTDVVSYFLVWMEGESPDDFDQGITTPALPPDLANHGASPATFCAGAKSNLTMDVGNKCLQKFRELAAVCNLTIQDFYCICYKVNCPNKTLTPEEEEGRRRAQNELRNARLRDNAVEYAVTATIFGLISITGVVGK